MLEKNQMKSGSSMKRIEVPKNVINTLLKKRTTLVINLPGSTKDWKQHLEMKRQYLANRRGKQQLSTRRRIYRL